MIVCLQLMHTFCTVQDSNDGHISDYVELHDSPANKRSDGNLPDSGRILQTNVGEVKLFNNYFFCYLYD